jgi:hypothetical protein
VGAARAVRNGWGHGVCLTTPVASTLHSLMVWDGNHHWGEWLGHGRWGGTSGGAW